MYLGVFNTVTFSVSKKKSSLFAFSVVVTDFLTVCVSHSQKAVRCCTNKAVHLCLSCNVYIMMLCSRRLLLR